jgi:hypothetical protein
MNRKNFWLDVGLMALFVLTILSLFLDGRVWRTLHYGAGTLMIIGSMWHLRWHWSWIKTNVLRYPRNVNRPARVNRRVNIGLFALFALSGVSGLVIWLMELIDLSHLVLPFSGWYHGHTITGLLMFLLLLVHLVYHRKWLVGMVKRVFGGPTRNPNLSNQPS